MQYWNGNLITSTESEPTSSSASGIFDLTSQLIYKSASKWPGPPSGLVTANLVLHLDAGNTNSYGGTGTTWTDLTSNSNNVTLVNGPTFSQGAIIFDGTNDYATLTSTLTFTDHTFEAWIYHTSPNTSGDYGYITTNATHGLAVSEGGTISGLSNAALYYNNGGTAHLLNATLSQNVWTHLVATSERSTNSLKIYFNGSLVSTTSITNLGTSITRFGHFQGNGGLSLNAKLAQIRVYDDILTATEVLQNYNATKDTFGVVTDGLAIHVDAGDTNSYSGTGTTWSDLTSNSNDLTLTNGPVYSSTDGGTIEFDGSNDYAVSSNSITISGDFSFDAWVYLDTTAAGYDAIFSIGGYSLTSGLALFGPYFSVWSGGTQISSATMISQAAWKHVALTRSGSTNTLYIDGSSIMTFTNSNTLSGSISLGAAVWATSHFNYLPGKISNARLYNGTALSAAEVTHNYNALSGRF